MNTGNSSTSLCISNVVVTEDLINNLLKNDIISNVDFTNCDFKDLTLSSFSFTNCNFNECLFKDCCLVDFTFNLCLLKNCRFIKNIWEEVKFESCKTDKVIVYNMISMAKVKYSNCKLTRFFWSGIKNFKDFVIFYNCFITACKYTEILLKNYNFTNCTFTSTIFEKCGFKKTHLYNCVFKLCEIKDTQLSKTIIELTIWDNVVYKKVRFNKSVKIKNTRIIDTSFKSCNIPLEVTKEIVVCPISSSAQSTFEQEEKSIVAKKAKLRPYRFITEGL